MKNFKFTLIQWTWGLPQTLLGAAVYLTQRKKPHSEFGGACVTEWDKDSGVSLGNFIFVPKGHSKGYLIEHEYGHSIQSLILGPAYLLLIGAPSIIWNRLPYFGRMRARSGKSYYSVPFEKTASILGAKAAPGISRTERSEKKKFK